MTNETLSFYDANASAYAANSQVNERLAKFLAFCKAGGKILELGAGSGRDAQVMIEAGFDVDATDASVELAAIAGKLLGQPVRILRFQDLKSEQEYDGVYASASLLHATRMELTANLSNVYRALKAGGVTWASFKIGLSEGHDRLGRYYNYLSQDELIACFREAAAWSRIDLEIWHGAGYDHEPTQWMAVTAWR
jgi:cyclopropane fatty-acyl-phospholipid synthase-like methyltransferase